MLNTFLPIRPSHLRAAIIVYCCVLYAFLALGAFSTQRIGAMTWGPTTDFWAAAIAISDIELGMDGGIGRREVAFAQAKVLTPTGSDRAVHDEETRRRVLDPVLVTKAFKDAATINLTSIKPLPLDSGMFVTTVFEDIGFADFYGIAFRLFGYDAFSTYKLYMLILGISTAAYVVGQWRSPLGLSVLALFYSALFLLTTSSVFSLPSVPSLASNRALGTLAMMPTLYLVVAAFGDSKTNHLERFAILLQIIVLAFCVFLRTSTIWTVIGLGMLLIVVIGLRVVAIGKVRDGNFLSTFFQSADTRRAIYVFLAAILSVSLYSAVRTSQLHFIYDTDDVLPHHLRWHSAYLALTHHPDFVKHPEFFDPGQTGGGGDGIGWSAYKEYMANQFPNTPSLSRVTGGIFKVRIHDHIMKEKFFAFAISNPLYIVRLYLYYKPARYLSTIVPVVMSVPISGWLLAIPGWVIFTLALLANPSRNFRLRTIPAVGLLLCCSFAPFIWAYAATHTVSDHFTILIVASFMLLGWATSACVERYAHTRCATQYSKAVAPKSPRTGYL